MKVVTLKAELKKRGLLLRGVKRELQARLIEAVEGGGPEESEVADEETEASMEEPTEASMEEPTEATEPSEEPTEATEAATEPATETPEAETPEVESSQAELLVGSEPVPPSEEPSEPAPADEGLVGMDAAEDTTETVTDTVDNLATSDVESSPAEPSAKESLAARLGLAMEEAPAEEAPAPAPVAVETPAPAPTPAAKPKAVPDFGDPEPAPAKPAAPTPAARKPTSTIGKKRSAAAVRYEEPGYSYEEPDTLHDYEEPAESATQPSKKIKLSSSTNGLSQLEARAKRFGTTVTAAIKKDFAPSAQENLAAQIKSRAARFGTTATLPQAKEQRVNARKRRFGGAAGPANDAIAKRQARFGTTAAPSLLKAAAAGTRQKTQRTSRGAAGGSRQQQMEFEARKRRRMNKFGSSAFEELPVGIPKGNPYGSRGSEGSRIASRAARFGTTAAGQAVGRSAVFDDDSSEEEEVYRPPRGKRLSPEERLQLRRIQARQRRFKKGGSGGAGATARLSKVNLRKHNDVAKVAKRKARFGGSSVSAVGGGLPAAIAARKKRFGM